MKPKQAPDGKPGLLEVHCELLNDYYIYIPVEQESDSSVSIYISVVSFKKKLIELFCLLAQNPSLNVTVLEVNSSNGFHP